MNQESINLAYDVKALSNEFKSKVSGVKETIDSDHTSLIRVLYEEADAIIQGDAESAASFRESENYYRSELEEGTKELFHLFSEYQPRIKSMRAKVLAHFKSETALIDVDQDNDLSYIADVTKMLDKLDYMERTCKHE